VSQVHWRFVNLPSSIKVLNSRNSNKDFAGDPDRGPAIAVEDGCRQLHGSGDASEHSVGCIAVVPGDQPVVHSSTTSDRAAHPIIAISYLQGDYSNNGDPSEARVLQSSPFGSVTTIGASSGNAWSPKETQWPISSYKL
jgi:hypothetical protein